MKIKSIILISAIIILFNGCFATTSANLEKQYLMNKFTIKKDYKTAASYTYEMFQICKTNNLLDSKRFLYSKILIVVVSIAI